MRQEFHAVESVHLPFPTACAVLEECSSDVLQSATRTALGRVHDSSELRSGSSPEPAIVTGPLQHEGSRSACLAMHWISRDDSRAEPEFSAWLHAQLRLCAMPTGNTEVLLTARCEIPLDENAVLNDEVCGTFLGAVASGIENAASVRGTS